jgi:hypothetical protein
LELLFGVWVHHFNSLDRRIRPFRLGFHDFASLGGKNFIILWTISYDLVEFVFEWLNIGNWIDIWALRRLNLVWILAFWVLHLAATVKFFFFWIFLLFFFRIFELSLNFEVRIFWLVFLINLSLKIPVHSLIHLIKRWFFDIVIEVNSRKYIYFPS